MADQHVAAEGMSNLAHAIRRSMALYVAMSITPPEEGEQGMLARADRMAAWINGRAAADPPQQQGGGEFLGVDPWRS